ncbi:MAG TPA: dUTP diphosphatase [bacterium]|nr:dUTP diphosphatase [bacterium]
MQSLVDLRIKRLEGNTLPLPEYKTIGSAGFDLMACIDKDEVLESGQIKLIGTGLSFEIPVGYEIQIRPRSGLAAKNGISIVNTPGTIDSDYRGEVKIILINHSKDKFVIKNGDRIAQAVLMPVVHANLIEVNDLSTTQRGSGGFGHTGV